MPPPPQPEFLNYQVRSDIDRRSQAVSGNAGDSSHGNRETQLRASCQDDKDAANTSKCPKDAFYFRGHPPFRVRANLSISFHGILQSALQRDHACRYFGRLGPAVVSENATPAKNHIPIR